MSYNSTPRRNVQRTKRISKPYSPFPHNGKFYLRNRSGECFKAQLLKDSFTWVEIDSSEYLAANDDK